VKKESAASHQLREAFHNMNNSIAASHTSADALSLAGVSGPDRATIGALELQASFYSRSFKETGLAMILIDITSGRVLDVNSVFIKAVGWKREEVLHKQLFGSRAKLFKSTPAPAVDTLSPTRSRRDKPILTSQAKSILANINFINLSCLHLSVPCVVV